MPHVEIYTQPWCPFCTRAKRLFERKGVPFDEIDAPHGTGAREEAIRRSGGRTTVPQIFIDGRYVGDCDAVTVLDAKGKLDALLAMA